MELDHLLATELKGPSATEEDDKGRLDHFVNRHQ